MTINATIEALKRIWADPTADEVADLLWLAHQIHQAGPLSQSTQPSVDPTPEPSRVQPPPNTHPSPKRLLTQRPGQTEPESEPVGNVFPETMSDPTGPMSSTRGISFRSPAASALPGVLELGRAIRPLLRRVPSPTESVIDEEATVELLVEQGLLSLVLRPTWSRWLAVDLVVDESASMVIWRQTTAELRRFLERHGAFRDVRVWGIRTDPTTGRVQLYPRTAIEGDERPRSPKELTDPSGRRLILMVSDCVSPGWHNGSMFAVLQSWGERMPVAIVQMLPRRLWSETALGKGRAAEMYATTPGTPNTQLRAELRYKRSSRRSSIGLKIPVVTLEPDSLMLWARMVAGGGGAAAPGFVFRADLAEFAEDLSDSETTTRTVGNVQPDADALLVQNFREAASPTAWKLAGYFAAAPLTLPVMRLVQHTMLPEPLSRQVHLAEVFLGGLLRQVTPASEADDPERVRYDFVTDRVRELLLNTLNAPDAIAVLRSAVSEFIEEHAGHAFDFDAILADPDAAATMPISEQLTPFASVAAKVLQRLGGRYVQAAEHLSGSGNVRVRPRTLNTVVELEIAEEGIPYTTLDEMLTDDSYSEVEYQTDEYIKLGDDYYTQKQYEEAIIAYQQAASINPSNFKSYTKLGLTYYKLKRYEEAMSAYKLAIEIDPNNSQTYNGLGNVFSRLKQYEDEAITAYQLAITLDTTYIAPYVNLGNVYRTLKQYDEALNTYKQALSLAPNDAELYINLGNVYLCLKQYEDAIAAYQKTITLNPNNTTAHSNLGHVYYIQKLYEEAITVFKKAIAIDPTIAYPYNGLGLVYHSQKRYEEAITTYQYAISLAPTYAKTYTNLGNVYVDIKRYEEGITAHQQAVALNSTDAYPYTNLGRVYEKLERYEEAITAHQQAITLDPNAAYLYNNLGRIYRDLGRDEEAIMIFQQAIGLDSTFKAAYSNLGFVYTLQRRYDEAIMSFQQAIILDPESLSQSSLAGLYRILGRNAEYERQLEVARPLSTNENEYNRACFESICGNVDEALALLATGLEQRQASLSWARRDPDLIFIRDDPRFQALVGEQLG